MDFFPLSFGTDTEADPSLNPLKETLFMQRSIRDVEASEFTITCHIRIRLSLIKEFFCHTRKLNSEMVVSFCLTVVVMLPNFVAL